MPEIATMPPPSPSSSGSTQVSLSVVICAYNAEHRIGLVLESLSRQQSNGLSWELVVIDNASRDRTSEVTTELCRKYQLPLRLIHEAQPGLAHARRRATLEVKSELLSFLDDDTVVNEDWITACVEFAEAHPNAGIFGARVLPAFEDPASKPVDFEERFAGILSIYDFGDKPIQLHFPESPNPVGAGMTGRTALFRLVFEEFRTLNIGRDQTSLAGGEDIEAIFLADRMGWEVWYAPSLCLHHVLPASRLTETYRDRWLIQTASCHAWLLVLNGRAPRATSAYYRKEWLKCESRVWKYRVMGWLPKGLSPKIARSGFWKQYYRSLGSGYHRLYQNPEAINRTFGLVDQWKRKTITPQRESA